jgi:hypothetical protein
MLNSEIEIVVRQSDRELIQHTNTAKGTFNKVGTYRNNFRAILSPLNFVQWRVRGQNTDNMPNKEQ